MRTLARFMQRFLQDETGVTSIEYALIAILISTVIIVGATALGTQLNSAYQAISTKIIGPS